MSKKVVSNSVFDKVENYLRDNYELRFNEVSLNYEIKSIGGKEWKELNTDRLFVKLDRANIKLSPQKLQIDLRSEVRNFNPVIHYFKNKIPKYSNSNKDYILELTKKIKLNSDTDFFRIQFKKYLVRCVRCSCETNYVNKNSIIFYSSAQNIGKSTFIRWLCPPYLNQFITENISNDKDSIIKLAKNFIINLDEMQSFMSKDIDFIKSLVSKEFINERLPYGKKQERINRIANFIGSTNKPYLLKDNVNVRWLIFDIQSIDFSYSQIDINDIWAQAYHLAYFDCEFKAELNSAELNYNDEKNKKFRAYTKEEEELMSYIETSENEKDFMTSTELVKVLKNVYINKNPITLGKVLNNIGFKQTRVGKERVKKYKVKMTDFYFDSINN